MKRHKALLGTKKYFSVKVKGVYQKELGYRDMSKHLGVDLEMTANYE